MSDWMKRRVAVELSIGRLEQEHRMNRCRLKGKLGDHINAILSAGGMKFRKLMKFIWDVLPCGRPEWQSACK